MAQRISEQVVEWLTVGGKAFTPQTNIPLVISKVGEAVLSTSLPSGAGGNINLYNQKGQLWTLGDSNASNSFLSSQVIISSSNNNTVAGGPVGLELWRGASGSWQIINTSDDNAGNLIFRHNWTSSQQNNYAITSVTMSSGALNNQYVRIHSTADASDQQTDESGALRVMGSIGAQNNIRAKNNFYSDMPARGYYLKDATNNSFAGMVNIANSNNTAGNFWIGANSSTGYHHSGADGYTMISAGYSTERGLGNPSIYISNPIYNDGSWSHVRYNILSYRDSGNLTYYVNSDTAGNTIAKIGTSPKTDQDSYKIPDAINTDSARAARQNKGGTIYLKLANKNTSGTSNTNKITLNIDSAGAKEIHYRDVPLTSELALSGYHTLTYDGTQYQEINPSAIGVLPGYSNGARLTTLDIDTTQSNLVGHAFYFIAADDANSSHTKPGSLGSGDGVNAQILQMNWDTTAGLSTQLGITHGINPRLFVRAQSGTTWNGWKEVPLLEENTASVANRLVRSLDGAGGIRSATSLYASDSSIGINATTATATPTNGAASTTYNLYVNGDSHLTGRLNVNGVITGSSAIHIYQSGVVKGTTPSAKQYRELIIKQGVNGATTAGTSDNLAIFGNCVTETGYNQVYFRNYQPSAGSSSSYSFVSNVTSNGTRFITSDFLIKPSATETYDLGAADAYWLTLYVKNQYLSGETANRLMWTDANKKVKAANHYASSTQVSIASTEAPIGTFLVNIGAAGSGDKKFVVGYGTASSRKRYLSVSSAGAQAYDASDAVSALYLQYEGSNVNISKSGLTGVGRIYIAAKNSGLFLTDQSNTSYGAIADNGTNLWVGARSSSDTPHTGSLYLHAGKDTSGNVNTTFYVHARSESDATAGTSYAIAYKAAGSGTQPVYVASTGKVTATTYALKATVNNSTSPRIAYYSSDTAISGGTGVEYASNGLHLTSSGYCITQYLNDTSNYGALAVWQKATPYTESYKPQIGFHNTGESICILPYETSTSPWGRAVGMSIGKDYTRLAGTVGNMFRLYSTATEASIYYKSASYTWTVGINTDSFGADTFSFHSGSAGTWVYGINRTSLHFRTNAFMRDSNTSSAATGALWIRDMNTDEARYVSRLYWYKYASDHASRANWNLTGLTVYNTAGNKELYVGITKESTQRGFISWSDGYIANNAIPFSNNTYNLGSASYRWKYGMFNNGIYITTSADYVNDINGGTAGSFLGPGRVELSASTPYIDFKFNNLAADYGVRVISDAVSRLHVQYSGTQADLTYNSRTVATGFYHQGRFYSSSAIETADYFMNNINTTGGGYYLFGKNQQYGRFYIGTEGTTDAVGQAWLMVGNSLASGTAKNARGYLRLYAPAGDYAQFSSVQGYLRQVSGSDSSFRIIGTSHDIWFGIGSGEQNRGIYHTGKGWGLYWDDTGSVTLQAETPSTTTAQNVYLWSKVAFRKTYSWGTAANRTALSNVATGTIFFQVL